MSFLVFGGKNGWIGEKVVNLLKEQRLPVYISTSRLEDRKDIIYELETIKPKYIINCAGITGRPNIDYCESPEGRIATIRSNVIGTLNLIDVANLYRIHVTNFATGCIYEYNESHPIDGKGFTEDDSPNFYGSFYARSKVIAETFARNFDNVLTLRLRMPIDFDLKHPRNFIYKILNYDKVIDVPNSMTILPELLPIAIDMTKKQKKGIYNFVNPGTISHNEILAMYRDYVDPNFKWVNFTIEEQNQILKARRSNCCLDVSKLMQEYPDIKPIKEAVKNIFQKQINL